MNNYPVKSLVAKSEVDHFSLHYKWILCMFSDTDMKLHMMGRGFTSWEVVLPGQLIL